MDAEPAPKVPAAQQAAQPAAQSVKNPKKQEAGRKGAMARQQKIGGAKGTAKDGCRKGGCLQHRRCSRNCGHS